MVSILVCTSLYTCPLFLKKRSRIDETFQNFMCGILVFLKYRLRLPSWKVVLIHTFLQQYVQSALSPIPSLTLSGFLFLFLFCKSLPIWKAKGVFGLNAFLWWVLRLNSFFPYCSFLLRFIVFSYRFVKQSSLCIEDTIPLLYVAFFL